MIIGHKINKKIKLNATIYEKHDNIRLRYIGQAHEVTHPPVFASMLGRKHVSVLDKCRNIQFIRNGAKR